MPAAAGLVVDASVALKWLIEEDGSEAALSLRAHDLCAPSLLRIEVDNVFRTLAGRGAVTAQAAADLFALFQTAPVTIVEPDDALERRALDLALALSHPVYDCLYLALAERLARQVVTADRRFLRAVRASAAAGLVLGIEEAATGTGAGDA